MAGQSSNLRASSSRRARKLVEIERDLDDAARAEEAKRLRHSQATATAHPTGAGAGAAVPVAPPLHHAAGNAAAMAVAFPMACVNGAALRWSTSATLGAAAGRSPTALPLPAIAGGVNVPAANTSGAAAPFLLAAAAPVQVQLVAPAPPAPALVGLPLAAALDKIKSDTLGSMLSALMPACDPPARQRQSWAGPPPPWWPSAAADWWVPEVVAHLHTIPVHTPVPYAPAYKLKKVQKVAALVAVVKHLTPDFDGIARKVRERARLTVPEQNLWKNGLANEAVRRKAGSAAPMPVPVFNVILQQQPAPAPPPPHGSDAQLPAPASLAAVAAENVLDGGVAATDADDGEQVVNLADDASVTAPAGDGGQVVAAAEPEQEQGQDGDDGVMHGGAMAGDAGGEQPVDIPGDVNDAAVAADFDQLLDDMLAPYQVQVQQVQEVHQVVDAEAPCADETAPEGPRVEEAAEAAPEGRPWYAGKDMRSIFDDFDMPVGTPHSYYY